MKRTTCLGCCVPFFKTITLYLLGLGVFISTTSAQTYYLSSFSDPNSNYAVTKPGCLLGVSVPDLENPENTATYSLADSSVLNPGQLLGLSAALACNGFYSIRTSLNLNGLTQLPASITPYNAGFKVKVSDAATLSLLGGDNNRVVVKTYLNGVQQEVATANLIGLSLLQPGIAGNLGFTATKDFNQVGVEISPGVLSLGAGSTINFFYAYASTTQVPILLPVKLAAFSASVESKSVGINWIAASEINVVKYELQRSSDGGNTFTTLTTLSAKGNAASETKYTYADGTVLSGSYVYRLKMIDKDGSSEYSKLVSVKLTTSSNWKIYPTLLNSGTNLNVNVGAIDGKVQVQLANLQGQVLRTANVNTDNKIVVNTSSLSAGVYVLKLYQAGQLQTSEKIVIQ